MLAPERTASRPLRRSVCESEPLVAASARGTLKATMTATKNTTYNESRAGRMLLNTGMLSITRNGAESAYRDRQR